MSLYASSHDASRTFRIEGCSKELVLDLSLLRENNILKYEICSAIVTAGFLGSVYGIQH